MDDAGWCVTAVAMDLVAITDVVAAEIDFYLLERQRQCCQCVLLSHMRHHHSPCQPVRQTAHRENYFYQRIYVISFQVIQWSD